MKFFKKDKNGKQNMGYMSDKWGVHKVSTTIT